METLDCRGQQCPQPVVQARQLMLEKADQPFCVLVDDTTSKENVTRLANKLGYSVSTTEDQGIFRLKMVPVGNVATEPDTVSTTGPTIIYIGSDEMGNGDQKLGQILMKNFIFTLTEGDVQPDAIYFVNTGVRLTVGGSDVLEPLEKLASNGVDIASCGLCLEYFDFKGSLAVGRISNMLELVNALEGAGNIIRL